MFVLIFCVHRSTSEAVTIEQEVKSIRDRESDQFRTGAKRKTVFGFDEQPLRVSLCCLSVHIVLYKDIPLSLSHTHTLTLSLSLTRTRSLSLHGRIRRSQMGQCGNHSRKHSKEGSHATWLSVGMFSRLA